jgi:hypothetical protein
MVRGRARKVKSTETKQAAKRRGSWVRDTPILSLPFLHLLCFLWNLNSFKSGVSRWDRRSLPDSGLHKWVRAKTCTAEKARPLCEHTADSRAQTSYMTLQVWQFIGKGFISWFMQGARQMNPTFPGSLYPGQMVLFPGKIPWQCIFLT